MSQSNEAARARESLEARLASMRRTLAEDQPEAEGLRGEDILSVERRVCYDVQLSWGGPSDWLRVFVEDGAVTDVEYHYADWGTHEEVLLAEAERRDLIRWVETCIGLT